MPWPFSRRRDDDGAAAAAPAPSTAPPASSRPAPRPFTADDFRAPRRVVPVARDWATLEPLRPGSTAASAPIVAPLASFVTDLAGTQSLIHNPILREVSSAAPAGRIEDAVAAAHSLALPPQPTVPVGEGHADIQAIRRPAAVRELQARGSLSTYEGELRPVDPSAGEWDVPDDLLAAFGEPEVGDDGIPEELPPPIFTTLLAQRTGQSLAELRPDLAGKTDEEIDEVLNGPPAPRREPSRKRSLAESRRMGLGAPQHSTDEPGDELDDPDVDDDEAPEGPPPGLAAALLEAAERTRAFLAQVEADQAQAEADAAATALADAEAELEAARLAGPMLKFRSAPGAPVRRTSRMPMLPEAVPDEVRNTVHRVVGVDPGPTVVHRGPHASAAAAAIGARAFTRDGEIFLPAEHGPLDTPVTRGLLAHELTHVVQRRVFGSSMPDRASAAGRRLEAEARSVQRHVEGLDDRMRIAPVVSVGGAHRAQQALRASAEEAVRRGYAVWGAEGELVFGGGGHGEPWAEDSGADTALQQAIAEERRLYDSWRTAWDARGSNPQAADEASASYLTAHAEFMRRYGSQLNPHANEADPRVAQAIVDDRRAYDVWKQTHDDSTRSEDDRRQADATYLTAHGEFMRDFGDRIAFGSTSSGSQAVNTARQQLSLSQQLDQQRDQLGQRLVDDTQTDDQRMISSMSGFGGLGTLFGQVSGWQSMDTYNEQQERIQTRRSQIATDRAFVEGRQHDLERDANRAREQEALLRNYDLMEPHEKQAVERMLDQMWERWRTEDTNNHRTFHFPGHLGEADGGASAIAQEREARLHPGAGGTGSGSGSGPSPSTSTGRSALLQAPGGSKATTSPPGSGGKSATTPGKGPGATTPGATTGTTGTGTGTGTAGTSLSQQLDQQREQLGQRLVDDTQTDDQRMISSMSGFGGIGTLFGQISGWQSMETHNKEQAKIQERQAQIATDRPFIERQQRMLQRDADRARVIEGLLRNYELMTATEKSAVEDMIEAYYTQWQIQDGEDFHYPGHKDDADGGAAAIAAEKATRTGQQAPPTGQTPTKPTTPSPQGGGGSSPPVIGGHRGDPQSHVQPGDGHGEDSGTGDVHDRGGSAVLNSFEEQHYEDLTDRLLPRILSRLRTELLVGRERSGRV